MRFFLLVISFTASIMCANAIDMDASTCVAPKEYAACHEKAQDGLDECNKFGSRGSEGYDICAWPAYAQLLNCVQSYCWNNVYGCAYQNIINWMIFDVPKRVDVDKIPFWPAPADAPRACSCNQGLASKEHWELLYKPEPTCLNELSGIDDGIGEERQKACSCCYLSLMFSIIIDICPDSELPLLRFNESSRNDYSNQNGTWFDCAYLLSRYDCIKDLGYKAPPSTRTIYQPSNLPQPGTKPWTDRPGQVTAPLSGWTYTWSGASDEFVVTAFSPSGTVISVPTLTGSNAGSDSADAPATSTTSGPIVTEGNPAPTSAGKKVTGCSSMFLLFLPFGGWFWLL